MVDGEGFSGMMMKAIGERNFMGYTIGSKDVDVSLKQVANDTLFFVDPSPCNVVCIKALLSYFEFEVEPC